MPEIKVPRKVKPFNVPQFTARDYSSFFLAGKVSPACERNVTCSYDEACRRIMRHYNAWWNDPN